MCRPILPAFRAREGGRLFRTSSNPKETLILLEWDDLERARMFAQSDDLREMMKRAEVADEPSLWLLQEADHPPG